METNDMKPKCSVHEDEDAKAVCVEKKELLCFTCALERAKSGNLDNIQEIDKLSEGNERFLLEYLVLNQIASKKETYFVEYEREVGKVTENLEHEVNKFYSQLTQKINVSKENSLRSIKTQAETFLKTFYREKNEFESVQKTMKQNIENLLVNQSYDIENCKFELEKVRTKLTENTIEFESTPKGTFIAHKRLQDVSYKSEDGLGEVNIFKNDDYSRISQEEANNSDEAYHMPTTDTDSMPPKLPPKPKVASSEKNTEKPKPLPRSKPYQVPLNADNADETTKSKESSTPSITESDLKAKSKDEKPRKSMLGGIFRTKEKRKPEVSKELKSKPEVCEELYEDVSFLPPEKIPIKHLINTTRSLKGLETPNQSPFQFSKIVALGDNRVCLLSTSHSLVAVSHLDGTVLCSKTYHSQVTSIVAMEINQIAILTEESKIYIVDVSGGQIEVKGSIDMKFELSDITGFDYSKRKSHFAISTRTKHLIVDTKGKKVNSTDIGNVADSSDIATTYDFEKDRYFVLNMEQKTLNCVVLKSLECIWKCKCGDQQFQPKAICLYKDERA